MNKEDKFPTYDEMLEMGNEEEFKACLLLRTELNLRPELLEEMIDHEKRTQGLEKTTAGKDIPATQRMILDVFDRDKSKETVRLLYEMQQLTGGEDLVLHAIFAKTTSDRAYLGTQREFSSFVN